MFKSKLDEAVLFVGLKCLWPHDGISARFVKGLESVFVGALVSLPSFQLRVLLVRGVGQLLNFSFERRKLTNVDELRWLVLIGQLELGCAALFQIPFRRSCLHLNITPVNPVNRFVLEE